MNFELQVGGRTLAHTAAGLEVKELNHLYHCFIESNEAMIQMIQ
jgi:hypothetical protein